MTKTYAYNPALAQANSVRALDRSPGLLKLLDFIQQSEKFPSYAEMRSYMGWSHDSSAYDACVRLAACGALKMITERGERRRFELVDIKS